MKRVLALIVAKQDVLQNGLLAVLSTIPRLSAVLVAEDVSSGLRMIGNHGPRLVLVDMDLPEGEAQMILEQIRSQRPRIRCIALADDVQQERTAATLEADAVLLKGFRATTLIDLIEELLSERGSGGSSV
jgi:DNA-binding NarL/FixJ family response regulator